MARTSFVLLVSIFFSSVAYARINFEPYYSVSSTKSLKPNRSEGTEEETRKLREEKGIRASLSFYRLFKLQLSVGQSFNVKTTDSREIVDEYGEINFSDDVNTSTSATVTETKIKDTQNKGKLTLAFDPGFWIFVMRMKAGLTANQRLVSVHRNGVEIESSTPPITYKPHAGIGLGVKINPRIYGIIEYSFYFYKFPETEPFERSASVGFGFSI